METERLIIRDHQANDLEDLYALLSNSKEMFYIMDLFVDDIKGAMLNLQTAIDEIDQPDRKKYFFAIIEKKTNTYVGEIGFTILERTDSGNLLELGYFIKNEFWNKGYTTEAARRCLKFAFENLNAWKITTGCVKDNVWSEKVMIKLGFIKEGELVKHQFVNGEWKNRVIYGLLAIGE